MPATRRGRYGEGVVTLHETFADRRVLVTGHTGFKGSWLVSLLRSYGAEVTGYALEAEEQSMFRALNLATVCKSIIADVRDAGRLSEVVAESRPDFVFHLAAQPLVLASYEDPLGTLSTNVMGTANVLEALRRAARPCVVVIVTTDKCYENQESIGGYTESDRLGGHDLYSASKAAAELVTAAYRRSFFAAGAVRVATARAGNVIGGGDWTADRIVPDCIRALRRGQPVFVRNPRSVRPWQHVLDALAGYVALAEKLAGKDGDVCAEAWNFGPSDAPRSVQEIVEAIIAEWGSGTWWTEPRDQPHETGVLRLSIEKAQARLGWRPRWNFEAAIARTADWYKANERGDMTALRELTRSQIEEHAGGAECRATTNYSSAR
jgi:CDP-glucose 4,6-dehydratase